MKLIKVIFFIGLCFTKFTDTKIFRRCDLARELIKQKFSRTMLSNWICMIESESGSDTKNISPYPRVQGIIYPVYRSFGLFQINNKTYCGTGYTGGKCRVRCEDLLNDNITKAAKCAQIVLNSEGFKAWRGWELKCKPNQNSLPPLNDCFRTALAG